MLPLNGSVPNADPLALSRVERVPLAAPTTQSVGLPVGVVLDEMEEEQKRLEAEIVAVKMRAANAQQLGVVRDAETKSALRLELAASRESLAEIEAQHTEAVTQVEEETSTEVRRILEAARCRAAEIDAMREVADPPVRAVESSGVVLAAFDVVDDVEKP